MYSDDITETLLPWANGKETGINVTQLTNAFTKMDTCSLVIKRTMISITINIYL